MDGTILAAPWSTSPGPPPCVPEHWRALSYSPPVALASAPRSRSSRITASWGHQLPLPGIRCYNPTYGIGRRDASFTTIRATVSLHLNITSHSGVLNPPWTLMSAPASLRSRMNASLHLTIAAWRAMSPIVLANTLPRNEISIQTALIGIQLR